MTLILICSGLLILILGGEAVVRGAVGIGKYFNLSPVFIGMFIVGLGTSLPELVIGVQATMIGKGELTVGNVVGSNIANILLVLAFAALIFPITKPAYSMKPVGFVLLAISLLVAVFGFIGVIEMWHGAAMLLTLLVLLIFEYWRANKNQDIAKSFETPEQKKLKQNIAIPALLTLAGLALLPIGAYFLIDGASQAAKILGVSDAVIGITIVAIGTSLPELASAGVAAWRGHSGLVYGNVIGSNFFNILGILGASALVAPLPIPYEILVIDTPIVVLSAAIMVYFVTTEARMRRTEALTMLFIYAAYIFVRLDPYKWMDGLL